MDKTMIPTDTQMTDVSGRNTVFPGSEMRHLTQSLHWHTLERGGKTGMKLPLMAAALVCMAFLLPVAGLAQVGQQESNQDQRVLREVRQILANEHAFDGMSISSSVHHGIVTLDGTVSSQAAKVLASTEIENVDGIKSVMNNLNVVGGAPRPTTAAPSGAIENKNLILPYGSILPVRITDEINSKTAHANDVFHGTIATNVIANGYVMLPAGTPLQGRVVEAKPAGHLVGSAVLTIELTRLTVRLRRALD
jgi:hypothetical protein